MRSYFLAITLGLALAGPAFAEGGVIDDERDERVIVNPALACQAESDFKALERAHTKPHVYTEMVRNFITEQRCGVLPQDLRVWIAEDRSPNPAFTSECVFVQEHSKRCFWVGIYAVSSGVTDADR